MKKEAGTGLDGDGGSETGSASGSPPGAGPGPFRGSGMGHRLGEASFDHERLEVYRVAREFVVMGSEILGRKMSRELHDQFERSSLSILFNIGEGAGKTAKADKQRFYEIARGSTTEAATQLDVMLIRHIIDEPLYLRLRELLVRVAQMLSRLCRNPRFT